MLLTMTVCRSAMKIVIDSWLCNYADGAGCVDSQAYSLHLSHKLQSSFNVLSLSSILLAWLSLHQSLLSTDSLVNCQFTEINYCVYSRGVKFGILVANIMIFRISNRNCVIGIVTYSTALRQKVRKMSVEVKTPTHSTTSQFEGTSCALGATPAAGSSSSSSRSQPGSAAHSSHSSKKRRYIYSVGFPLII